MAERTLEKNVVSLAQTAKILNIVSIDQHGTYLNPRPWTGGVKKHTKSITEEQAKILTDPDTDWHDLASGYIKIFGGLKENIGLFPRGLSLKDLFTDFLTSTLRFRIIPEQERGLVAISHDRLAQCTLVSGMEAEHYGWAWWVLGKKARNSLDKNRQMILRIGNDSMFSKLIGIGFLLHSYPETEKRLIAVDEDRNIAKAASQIFDIPCFVPITEERAKRDYPAPEFPPSIQRRSGYGEIIFSAGLPEVRGYLISQRTKKVVVSPSEAAEVIMLESQFPSTFQTHKPEGNTAN